MPELRAKSIRGDFTMPGTSGTNVATMWKWAPERKIKIKKVYIGFDHSNTGDETYWMWLSKGSVDMPSTSTLNEEEQIIAAMHVRLDLNGEPANEHQFYDFNPDYFEVEDGEALYFNIRTGVGETGGYIVIVYYLPA